MTKKIISLLRVKQWIKNLFVFVPLLFSRHLFEAEYSLKVLIGFLVFSFVSSIVYILNDISDVESDRQHPKKKNRAIASGAISVDLAYKFLVVIAMGIAILIPYCGVEFAVIAFIYLVINFFYSKKLKNIVLLDVFCIAAGFMLRVISGGVIISVYISSWLILTTMFISLFLAIMKRRSELEVVKDENTAPTRKVLTEYTVDFADQIATITAAGVMICYALYTVSERTVKAFGTENLIYTTPFVAFGIFRYMFLVRKYNGEDTAEILVTDRQMIVNIICYLIATVLIIYKLK